VPVRGVRDIGAGRIRRERLGETEVQNLDDAVGRDLDVGRLQIAVDDVAFMRGFNAVDQLLVIGNASSNGIWPWSVVPSTNSITR